MLLLALQESVLAMYIELLEPFVIHSWMFDMQNWTGCGQWTAECWKSF